MEDNPKLVERVFTNETIVIGAADGSLTIDETKNVFETCINADYLKREIKEPGPNTPETEVHVHKLVRNASFGQIFKSFKGSLGDVCLSQHQVVNFCTDSKKYLAQNGSATFFLFKTSNGYYVAYVYVDAGKSHVIIYRFDHPFMWKIDRSHYLVVPAV